MPTVKKNAGNSINESERGDDGWATVGDRRSQGRGSAGEGATTLPSSFLQGATGTFFLPHKLVPPLC